MYVLQHKVSKYYLTGFNSKTGQPEYHKNVIYARRYTKELAEQFLINRTQLVKHKIDDRI